MPITLGTNIASLNAQRRLADSTNRLSSVYERLSSGQRINRASDDAAGLAVASTLNARAKVYTQAVRNVNDGVSALTIADQAVGTLTEIITRQQELAAQAANGVYSTTQRQALDTEAQALAQEYNRVIQTTTFNNVKLLDGSTPFISLQAGVGNGSVLNSQILAQTSSTSASLTDLGTTTDTTTSFDFNGLATTFTPNGFLVGDLNNDGISDIVAFAITDSDLVYTSTLQMQVFLGNSGGDFSAPSATATKNILSFGHNPTGGTLQATLTDTNGDGDLDIRLTATFTFDSGGATQTENEEFTNLTAQNGGTFSLNTAFNDNLTPTGNAITAGGNNLADFNGDGINDNLNISGGNFTIGIHNTSTTYTNTITTQSVAQASISLLNQAGARSAMTTLQAVADTLGQVRGNIGASLSRAASATNVLGVASTNYAAAESRIMSADIAAESADLTRNQILQQTGASVLAQANQQPQIALMLLRG